MKPVMFGCAAGLLLALCVSHVNAQSLVEIARREKLRREALAQEAKAGDAAPKVYTSSDLRGGGRLTSTEGAPPAPSSSAADTTETATSEDAPETAGAPAGEDQWRNRISAVREARDRAQLLADALQNRADGLLADFTGRDDPAQRSVIEQERTEALEELDRTNAEIRQLDQDVLDIQEEARRANVPPGWLR